MMRSTPWPGEPAVRAWQLLSRMAGLCLILLMAAGATAEIAAAQSMAPIALRVGETIRGTLSSSDPVLTDDSYYDLYRVDTDHGDRLTVTLRAPGFDAYLSVGEGWDASSFSLVDSDDDGAGGTDSRIELVSNGGPYLIRANSLAPGSTGDYTLSVTRQGSARDLPVSSISPGGTVHGTLSSSDPTLGDGSRYDLYRFHGSAGDRVEVTMRSGDFDAYLTVGHDNAGVIDELETDDDGAGGTDSRVALTLPRTGAYLIRSNSLFGGSTGSYTLELAGSTSPLGNPAGESIFLGQVLDGRLTSSDPVLGDDSRYDLYRFDASAGDRLVISLNSDDFDPYLSLGRLQNGTFELLESDDDSGPGTNARLEYVVPASGTYAVRANSYSGGASGAYTLSLGRR